MLLGFRANLERGENWLAIQVLQLFTAMKGVDPHVKLAHPFRLTPATAFLYQAGFARRRLERQVGVVRYSCCLPGLGSRKFRASHCVSFGSYIFNRVDMFEGADMETQNLGSVRPAQSLQSLSQASLAQNPMHPKLEEI